ncbi:hypothetical protein F4781DRAFT_403902 [Annulohypoxylon bovei var. microspora]|nr:hypothetical protein F4781DRAFT_403902 [Annulohypoxylon bovei var. microspora]
MAEIADSDSPDPLSSTPPRRGQFTAPSTASTTSSNSDLRSLLSESPPGEQLYAHYHRQRRMSSNSTRSASASSSSPLPMSSPPPPLSGISREGHAAIDNFLGEFMSGHHDDPFGAALDEEEEESLFVDDDPYPGLDYDDLEPDYDSDDLDMVDEEGVPRLLLEDPWADSDDSFEEDQFLDRMNPQRDADNDPRQLDELVEMEVMQPGNPRIHQRDRQQQPQAQPEVIDLTGDHDSPAQPAHRNHSQNARRQRSQQRNTPPRLARSDASYMGSRTVIDLISDSDDEEPAIMPPPRRNDSQRPRPRPYPRIPSQGPPRIQQQPRDPAQPGAFGLPANADHAFHHLQQFINNIPLFRLMNNQPAMGDNRDEDDIVIMGHRNRANAPNAPNAPHAPRTPRAPHPAPNLPPINLDYLAHPFANPPYVPGGLGAKPAHEPPKETREGFTRNTGEDVIAICPSCELELAYDPDDDEANQGPPAKKARTKKDKAEHHFWAVKACGHVYCRACYENRKPVGKHPVHVGFRRDPNGLKNHVLCAVEDCETDVSAKSAWVGIFM